MEFLAKGVEELKTQSEKMGDTSINGLKDAVANLPRYTGMKDALGIHTMICQECMAMYSGCHVEAVSTFEQDLCTNQTSNGVL